MEGEAPAQTVSIQAFGVQIQRSRVTECISDSEYTWSGGVTQVLASYDAGTLTAFGVNVSGEP